MNPAATRPKVLVPGSVLLDHYADSGRRFLGGACFNFAYHMHHLLGNVDFLSRVGHDDAGQFILTELERRHFPTHLIQKDLHKPTKTVQVRKDDHHEPYYLISRDVATDYLEMPGLTDTQLKAYQLVYFGTTIQSAPRSRATVRQLLAQTSGLTLCDINLRPGQYTPETIANALHTCSALKLNHQELESIARLYALQGTLEEQLYQLARRFAIPSICLTMAAEGSLLYQDRAFSQGSATPGPVRDTVGAGDAFSAIYALGLLLGWPPSTMLDLASRFAYAICTIEGAVPAGPDFYAPWKQQVQHAGRPA